MGNTDFPSERFPDFVVELRQVTQIWGTIAVAAIVAVFARPHCVAINVSTLGLIQPPRVIEIYGKAGFDVR